MSESLYAEARRRLDEGDPRSAKRLAEQVLATARGSSRPEQLGPAAQLLGECLFVVGDLEAANPLAQEALRIDESRGDAAAIGMDLNLLGVIQISTGELDLALDTLRRSYDLRAESLGPEHEDSIESLNNLAAGLWRAGQQQQSIELHQEALRRCERYLGEAHRRTAETLNALAVKVGASPEGNEQARELYERALAAAELALGPDTDLVARLLANLGVAYLNLEQPERAAPMLMRALELHELHFGPTSRWTAVVLAAIGELASGQGRHREAQEAFERAFLIRIEELGATDGETLDAAIGVMGSLNELAIGDSGELDEGVMAEATALFQSVIALRPELAPPFLNGGNVGAAEAAVQLRNVASRMLARRTPDTRMVAARERADALLADGDVAFVAGDLRHAEDRVREAIGLLETAFGPGSTLLVEPLRVLRLILRLAGAETEVLSILERIASILAGAYGEAHPLAVRALGEQYWQELREYGLAGGRETAQRIRDLAGRAMGEANPAVLLVSEAIERTRESLPPDARPDEVPLSVRRERFLSAPHAVADELLSDLDAVGWPTLEHAYGKAVDTPIHIRVLLAEDDRLRQDALQLLAESVLHQESAFSATAPAMRFVRRLLHDDRVPGRAGLVELLGRAHRAANGDPALAGELGDLPGMLSRLAATDRDTAVVEAAVEALRVVRGVAGAD